MKHITFTSLTLAFIAVIGLGFGAVHTASAEQGSGRDGIGSDVKSGSLIGLGRSDDAGKERGEDRAKPYKDDRGIYSKGVVGTVISINETTINVKSLRDGETYTVDASDSTVWKNGNGSSLSKLSAGDIIVVKGEVKGNDIKATAIMGGNWKDKFPGNDNWNDLKPGIMGTVTAKSGDTLTVKALNGTVYTVDTDEATFRKDKETTITIGDVAIGDAVIIQGVITGTTVVATNVFDVEAYAQKVEDKFNPDITGTVTAIDGMTITIKAENGSSYTVDVSDAKLRTTQNAAVSSKYTLSNIKVGDTLWIKGTITGSTVDATSIVDTNLAMKAAVANNPGFFQRIGGWFKGLFGRK